MNIKKNFLEREAPVAYLSMEIALEPGIKSYAGGLGVLAGDLLRSAADQKFPMVGVALFNREGYLKQKVDKSGKQTSEPDKTRISLLKKVSKTISIDIGGEEVRIGAWRYLLKNKINGFSIPVYLLDTDIDGNSPKARRIGYKLYDNKDDHRLKQEIILGIGGVRMLAALGYEGITKYHLNEGHGSLGAVELFQNSTGKTDLAKVREVRSKCIFTTHTPLARNDDVFPLSYIKKYVTDFPETLPKLAGIDKDINLAEIAMYLSGFVNGVSKAHSKIARKLFPGRNIKSITNGVHSQFWTSPELSKLFDRYISGWRNSNSLLRKSDRIPVDEIWSVHEKMKKNLISQVNRETSSRLRPEIFTIGYARRFTEYKRPLYIFKDLGRLLKIQESEGNLQIIFAGKAHRDDKDGQTLIKELFREKSKLKKNLNTVFWPDYDLEKAKLLVAGADLWLNTPLPPYEASGTSGMKAAHNGVPQASTLDGWWSEGYIAGKTGWVIKESGGDDIYSLLERDILPTYYRNPAKWKEIMRSTIISNAAFFNSERMLKEYIAKAYC